MKELICPNCHTAFSIDDAAYASIVSQVKNSEFNAEIDRRMAELKDQQQTEQKAAEAIAQQKLQAEASQHLVELSKKDSEIAQLQEQLKTIEQQKEADKKLALSAQENDIAALKAQIKEAENQKRIAVMEEQQKNSELVNSKTAEIAKLKAAAEMDKQSALIHENSLKEQYEAKLKYAQEQVAYYKEMKAKLSTKMIGESLEVHCSTLYNQMMRSMLPHAYFEKDNDASNGSKGDFIFKDFGEDGTEYISIMFEMKNEADETATKHKNEDFFKKLDSDRKDKKCEYAVLVSLLEPDSELYNGGIVDVSYKYDKMYVIRPQFFLPLISLLVQTSKKSLEYKSKLETALKKDADVTMFENKLDNFKTNFLRHYSDAQKKHSSAVAMIDDAIKKLTKMKELFEGSDKSLNLAERDAEGLTIRKLTYNNPTMKQKFDEARETNGQVL